MLNILPQDSEMKQFAEATLLELSVLITFLTATSAAWRTYSLNHICNNTVRFYHGEDGAAIDVTYGATDLGVNCRTTFTTDPNSRLVLWFDGYTYLSAYPQPLCYRQILLKNIRSDTVDYVSKEFCTSDDVTNEKYFSRTNYFRMDFTAKPKLLYATVFRLNIGRYIPEKRFTSSSDFKCNNGRYIPSSLHSRACRNVGSYDFCTDGTSCSGVKDSSDSGNGSGGSVAGIIVGVVLLVILGLVCFLCVGRCADKRASVSGRTTRTVTNPSTNEMTARAVFTCGVNDRTGRAIMTVPIDAHDRRGPGIDEGGGTAEDPEDLTTSQPPPAYSTIEHSDRIGGESQAVSTGNTHSEALPPDYSDVISNQEHYKVTSHL